ncbi:MAG: HEPN domain-containing protein [Bacteroidota bacterium]
MFDEKKQIEYWKVTALDNLETAEILFEKRKFRECLFFSHLTIEKLLKAHFVKTQKDFAPKVHNLEYLYSKTDLTLPEFYYDFLPKIMVYNIEGRYPDYDFPQPSKEVTGEYLKTSKEIVEWLLQKL